MSKRTERRAAEREARKVAFKQLRQQPSSQVIAPLQPDHIEAPETGIPSPLARAQAFCKSEAEPESPVISEVPVISEAQLIANRENAQLSKGPVSAAGKSTSSKNALKHGLTGQTVLLPTDDADEYHRRHDAALHTFQPATDEEQRLVQSITDSYWRLNRLQRIETGILMKGHIEFANKYEDQPQYRRRQLIETDTYLKYEKSIRNLHIQEARLHRRIEKDQAELARLQTIRKREERIAAERPRVPPPATGNGFEFSTPGKHGHVTPNRSQKPHTRAA